MTRKKTIAQLKEQIERLSKEYGHMYEKALFNGAFLADEPFIPEYLEFDMSEIRDVNDILVCRVYTKDGFSISRYISAKRKEWIIIKPGNPKPTEIVISSMEMGIKILQACGMDVSVYQYLTRETAAAETTIPEPV